MRETVKGFCIYLKITIKKTNVSLAMLDFIWWNCSPFFLLLYVCIMIKPQRLRIFFERNGFAVSTRLAELLGMKVKSVRLLFIYASFTTLIGGFVLYLTLAFWLKLKDLLYTKRTSVFDLWRDPCSNIPFFARSYYWFWSCCSELQAFMLLRLNSLFLMRFIWRSSP